MTGLLTLRRIVVAIALLVGLAAAGSYAYQQRERDQAWQSLLQDCSDCENRHAARLRFQSWQAERAQDMETPARLAQDKE